MQPFQEEIQSVPLKQETIQEKEGGALGIVWCTRHNVSRSVFCTLSRSLMNQERAQKRAIRVIQGLGNLSSHEQVKQLGIFCLTVGKL